MADSDSFLLPSEVVEESVGFSLDIGEVFLSFNHLAFVPLSLI